MRGFLAAVASLVDHGLQGTWVLVAAARGLGSRGFRALGRRLSICSTGAHLFHGMWELPDSGIGPMSPALAGRVFNH